ncbi:MAG TPA: hypothetical protein VEA59_06480 [Patescibacteria group bacterium]|nr:hypothetical protein [Patescibacteria group bacterium]
MINCISTIVLVSFLAVISLAQDYSRPARSGTYVYFTTHSYQDPVTKSYATNSTWLELLGAESMSQPPSIGVTNALRNNGLAWVANEKNTPKRFLVEDVGEGPHVYDKIAGFLRTVYPGTRPWYVELSQQGVKGVTKHFFIGPWMYDPEFRHVKMISVLGEVEWYARAEVEGSYLQLVVAEPYTTGTELNVFVNRKGKVVRACWINTLRPCGNVVGTSDRRNLLRRIRPFIADLLGKYQQFQPHLAPVQVTAWQKRRSRFNQSASCRDAPR